MGNCLSTSVTSQDEYKKGYCQIRNRTRSALVMQAYYVQYPSYPYGKQRLIPPGTNLFIPSRYYIDQSIEYKKDLEIRVKIGGGGETLATLETGHFLKNKAIIFWRRNGEGLEIDYQEE